jgi:hypothetical protein
MQNPGLLLLTDKDDKDEIIKYLYNLWEQVVTYVSNLTSDQLALIALGVSIGGLLIGIITLFYAAGAYHLQSKMFTTAQDLEEKRTQADEKERKHFEIATALKVPDTITFGNKVLVVPEFEEFGISEEIARLFHLESRFRLGDWVERGDELLAATFSVFSTYEKPSRWLAWMDSPGLTTPISLYSPVHGLIIGFNINRYYHKGLFPIILLPADEPSPDFYRISFYEEAIRHLDNNWSRIAYGYKRLMELESPPDRQTVNKIPLDKFHVRDTSKTFNVKDVTKEDTQILPYIRELCMKRIDLRPKINHLNLEKETRK